MGNQASHNDELDHKINDKKQTQLNPKFVTAFNSLSDGTSSIQMDKFNDKLGPLLGSSLWAHICGDENSQEMGQEQFMQHADALYGISSDSVARLLMPAQHLVETCLEADGIVIETEEERRSLQILIEDMTARGSDADSLIAWKNANCVGMFDPARDRINSIFSGIDKKSAKVPSKLLNPVQMFILRKSLPTTVYFPAPSQSDQSWVLLYSSPKDGLSINRFETKVFDYNGPTIASFRLASNEIYTIASDQEWMHSTKPFGGPYSVMFQFSPKFGRFDSAQPAIYCNFKNRTSAYGISYGQLTIADTTMANVQQIEVWGCAGSEAVEGQSKMKQRQKMQAERNAKVPMPGKWDTDKTILEMAGRTFYSEHRNQ